MVTKKSKNLKKNLFKINAVLSINTANSIYQSNNPEKNIRISTKTLMISERSCDTEDSSIDADNSGAQA